MTTPDSIWEYFRRSVDALQLLGDTAYSSAVPADAGQTASPPTRRIPKLPPFLLGRTRGEIDAMLREMRQELDFEVSLALMAAFEAILVGDCRRRRRTRPSDALTVRMRSVPTYAEDRLPLEGILDAWKEVLGPPSSHRIGLFKQAVGFRHWLAHGRQGKPKGYANFAPRLIIDRARDVQGVDARFPRLVQVAAAAP